MEAMIAGVGVVALMGAAATIAGAADPVAAGVGPAGAPQRAGVRIAADLDAGNCPVSVPDVQRLVRFHLLLGVVAAVVQVQHPVLVVGNFHCPAPVESSRVQFASRTWEAQCFVGLGVGCGFHVYHYGACATRRQP